MPQDGQTSINIPQLLAVAVVGFLAFRWFMAKPSGSNPPAPASSSANPRLTPAARRPQAIDPSRVEQVAAMFPQLDRRAIAWDLHRNGGNVGGTTERILGGRGLENPPPTFQPFAPEATASGSGGDKRPAAPAQPDLITRYGLQGRVSGKGKEAVPSEEQRRNAWSADKGSRAEALKRRREEMVLAARRKMMEKEGTA